jgi:hypothetical protein
MGFYPSVNIEYKIILKNIISFETYKIINKILSDNFLPQIKIENNIIFLVDINTILKRVSASKYVKLHYDDLLSPEIYFVSRKIKFQNDFDIELNDTEKEMLCIILKNTNDVIEHRWYEGNSCWCTL